MSVKAPKSVPATPSNTDSATGTVLDPTRNVIALTEAAIQRQDDLRAAFEVRVETQLAHLKEMAELRADHSKQMRESEADRLDKVRQVDVLAGTTATSSAERAIQALAAVTASNAETLRNALTTTAALIAKQGADAAAALATSTDSMMKDINTRIADLQKASYLGVGKAAVTDPQMAELVTQIRSLVETRATSTGKGEGLSLAWAIIIGAVTIIGGLWAMRPH